jgi:colicin import membrane protein
MTIELTQELIEIKPESALDVFTKPNGIKPYLDKIRVQLDAFVPIMDTKSGREEVASIAFKVAKSKTYLESVGKKLADEQKEIPKKIDATRKEVRDTLDLWKDEVRKPLTEWEAAEEARIARHSDAIGHMNFLTSSTNEIGQPYDARTLRECLQWVEDVTIGPHCEEFEDKYRRAREHSIEALKETIAKREVWEAEQKELAELRERMAAREAKDREDLIRQEAADKARVEEATRFEREQQAAQVAAKIAAEAAERRERELTEQAAAAERKAAEAIAQAQRDAELQAARDRKDREDREANKRHCAAINRVAVQALVEGGLSEDLAKVAVTLIAKKQVPHISIKY